MPTARSPFRPDLLAGRIEAHTDVPVDEVVLTDVAVQ